MRVAVARCVAIEGTRGWRIAKEKAAHKIDIIVALAQAAHAAVLAHSRKPQHYRLGLPTGADGFGHVVEIDPNTGRPVAEPKAHIRYVMVNERDAPATRGLLRSSNRVQ